MDDCIFCKIISKQIPTEFLDENEHLVVFMSLQNHPLIVTKKHFENLYQLDEETAKAVMLESIKISKAVKKGLSADGVNILQNNEAASGQQVFHYHMHIKPRFHKDSIRIDFDHQEISEGEQSSTIEKIKSALE